MVPALRELDPAAATIGPAGSGWSAILLQHQKVTAAESPKDWPDLDRPEMEGQDHLRQPELQRHGRRTGPWRMTEKYGWDFFEKLNKLNPLIGRSIDDAVDGAELRRARRWPWAARHARCAAPPRAIRWRSTTRPRARWWISRPPAIIKGSHSPNAAKLFIEFMAGPEYSKILAENFEQPLRTDVPAAEGRQVAGRDQVVRADAGTRSRRSCRRSRQWRDTLACEHRRHADGTARAMSLAHSPPSDAIPRRRTAFGTRLRRLEPATWIFVAAVRGAGVPGGRPDRAAAGLEPPDRPTPAPSRFAQLRDA